MKVKTSFAKKKRKATKISVFKNQFTSELKIVCLKKRLITDDDGEARQRAVAAIYSPGGAECQRLKMAWEEMQQEDN